MLLCPPFLTNIYNPPLKICFLVRVHLYVLKCDNLGIITKCGLKKSEHIFFLNVIHYIYDQTQLQYPWLCLWKRTYIYLFSTKHLVIRSEMIGGLLFGNRLTSEQFEGLMIGVCLIMDIITLTLMQNIWTPMFKNKFWDVVGLASTNYKI